MTIADIIRDNFSADDIAWMINNRIANELLTSREYDTFDRLEAALGRAKSLIAMQTYWSDNWNSPPDHAMYRKSSFAYRLREDWEKL